MSENVQFSIDQQVVYPSQGVGKVVEIFERDLGGTKTQFYKIYLEVSDMNVMIPVETVELTVKGNAKPGATVTVSAALAPREAGNKNVEWSLDVGEEIAVINANGQVRISKEAASGTKITVTCTALGAPEPVQTTVEIEVL